MKGYRFVDASCHFVCALCANLSCLGSVVVIICCLTTSLVINYHALLHSHWLHSETGFDSLTLALSRLESSRRDGVHQAGVHLACRLASCAQAVLVNGKTRLPCAFTQRMRKTKPCCFCTHGLQRRVLMAMLLAAADTPLAASGGLSPTRARARLQRFEDIFGPGAMYSDRLRSQGQRQTELLARMKARRDDEKNDRRLERQHRVVSHLETLGQRPEQIAGMIGMESDAPTSGVGFRESLQTVRSPGRSHGDEELVLANSSRQRAHGAGGEMLMLPEWLLDLPGHAEDDWVLVPRPEGIRCLLLASAGTTRLLTRSNHVIGAKFFPSQLPGGCRAPGKRQKGDDGLTLLDCILVTSSGDDCPDPGGTSIARVEKRLVVLDCLSWKDYDTRDCPFELRRLWLRDKMEQLPQLSTQVVTR